MKILRNVKDCRAVYREILLGYTYLEKENLYVKHFNESDLGSLEVIYAKCEKKLIGLGIENTKEKLDFLKKEDYWSEDEENSYVNAKYALADAFTFAETLQAKEQKEKFQATIQEKSEELREIDEKRREVLYPTIESFCDKVLNEHYVRIALYKDDKFLEPYFTEEEFSNISYVDLSELVKEYNEVIESFTDENLKRIAVNGFFLNSFLMSDGDPVKFYGKNVLEMTTYQMNLFGKGRFYKSILEEGKNPPDMLYDQISENGLDPIVSFYDLAHAQIKSERQIAEARAKRGR